MGQNANTARSTGGHRLAIVLVALGAIPAELPAQPAAAFGTAAKAEERSLEEILVQGRSPLSGLRQQMIELEDRFYERYNELNDNDLFDVHCALEVHTGSRFERRHCRAGYETRAHETEGREHLAAMQYAIRPSGPTNMEWIAPIPATVAIERQRADFRDNMIRLTQAHPELVALLRQRAELAELHAAEQRKLFRRQARPRP